MEKAEINYEVIGRYHAASKRAKELISKRNELLYTVSYELGNVSSNRYRMIRDESVLAVKQCDFDALQAKLSEAKSINDELIKIIEEINSIAPLAEEPEIRLG